MTVTSARTTGLVRVEGLDKVTGAATYAYEHSAPGALYAWVVQSTIASGTVESVDVDAVLGDNGVVSVLWHENAPHLQDTGSAFTSMLQGPEVDYRGQVVALVVAETAESAREAAAVLPVEYAEADHDVVLTADHPTLFTPDSVNGGAAADTSQGDADTVFESSPVQVDQTYRTPHQHNHAMEPHATTAVWDGDSLTVHDSNQGGVTVRDTLATAFGIEADAVRVLNSHVGGGFGSKGTARPAVVLAAMAARVLDRPVRLALTRHQMFDLVGYRTPTIQQIRLGADTDGRLRSITHHAISQTATIEEYAEQTATPTRMMYAAEHRRTTHRLATLDVAVPSWMRAPGETPGMFALETAMDELAVATGLDPIDLRIANEPAEDPEKHLPWSTRNLVACMRTGADRFGWSARREPGTVRDGRWLVGLGMAASTYPTYMSPASASVALAPDGTYTVAVNATDIGTGARTALLQVAATELEVEPSRIRILIGDTDLPWAGLAGGSMGTSSWGWAVVKAARQLRTELHESHTGRVPADGLEVRVDTRADVKALEKYSRHAFGAQFAEVRVDLDTAEVRVPRMLGMFAAGRIVNASTARSQLIGGMTMGLSMALHEGGVADAQFGGFANHDLVSYHIAANADVGTIEVDWLDEDDPHLGAARTKGIGEIGIVGAAAAVGNAIHNATGVRVRQTPMTLDTLLDGLPAGR